MGKLRDEAEALGIEIDGRWSNGTLERKIAEVKKAKADEKKMSAEPGKKLCVRLHKNYRPAGWYRIVGHYNDENELIPGEMAPPPYPGVEFEHKLWKQTVVELSAEEAQRLVENTVDAETVERSPSGAVLARKKTKVRKPLAELYADFSGVTDERPAAA